jgi:hypothetical protein
LENLSTYSILMMQLSTGSTVLLTSLICDKTLPTHFLFQSHCACLYGFFFFYFCFPVSKLTFAIYCLISSLISCFIESSLNWILLKGQADAALNYFCFLR